MEMSYPTEEYPDYDPEYEADASLKCSPIETNDFAKNFLPPFCYIIFIASIIGNGVVLLVVYKFEKLTTVTNIFLINLVASNIIFTFTLPFQAVYHSNEWIFGESLCKLVNSARNFGFYSSVLFLTLMTFDRYLAVVHCVVANKKRRSCYALALSSAVWSISLLASLDSFIFYTVKDVPIFGLICECSIDSKWNFLGVYKQFVLFFIFPLTVFVYCYFRIILTVMSTRMVGKHRTVRLIFVIVLMFFAFWGPHNIIRMINENRDPQQCDSILPYAEYVTGNIAYLYFCINPVFYTFLGRKFQNHVRGVLMSQGLCLTSHMTVSGSSRSLA